MADDDKTETAEDATATAAAGESQESRERTFTQAELDAIVAKRVAKAEKAAERRLREPETKPAQSKEPPSAPSSDDLVSEVAALKSRLALTEAMDDLDWKPSKEDAELLRDAFKSGGAAAMHKLAGRLKPQQETKPVDDPTGKYKSPGAPSGAPPEVLDRDATKWSRDYVERLRQEPGAFKRELEAFRNSLPGGGGGLFRKRIPTTR
jgi:hypothetical protein